MIFMTHPEHGANNVLPSEVETMKANGWKESTRDEWMAQKRRPVMAEVSEAPKRRGRPPKS